MKKYIFIILLSVNLYSSADDGEKYFDIGMDFIAKKNYDDAIKNYKKACDYGHGDGCYFLGDLYAHLKKERDMAIPFYKQSCNIRIKEKLRIQGYGEFGPCRNVALYFIDKGLRGNEDIIEEYMKKSCDLNNFTSCANLGKFYYMHKREKESIIFMKKACDLGSNIGCDSIGQFYLEGIGGLKKDYEKGISLLNKACNNKYEEACIHKIAYQLENKIPEKDKEEFSSSLKNLNIPKD